MFLIFFKKKLKKKVKQSLFQLPRVIASFDERQVSKETYYSVKRDLLQCQKRPTTVSKETY